MDNENIYDAAYSEAQVSDEVEVKNTFNEEPSKEKKKKRRNGKGIAKYIALALICSLCGGVIGSGVTYFVTGKNVSDNSSGNTVTVDPVSFATDSTALSAAEIYQKVAPAVVMVSTKTIQTVNGWFQQEAEGMGSGFIINTDGYILTNYHVIDGANEVTVTLSDGNEVTASVVNYDSDQDVAMIKINEDIEVPGVVELGDSDALQPGEEVLAIGNPLSKELSSTLTKGIVSALNRSIETETGVSTNLIQTDTAINSGNSGGPLINTKGEVIGINTLKASDGAEGIGFAIPINDVKVKIDSLSKPILNLGVSIRVIDESWSKKLKMEEGLYIIEVTEFSPAEKAGLKGGDLIVKVDGTRIKTFEELQEIKNSKEEGDSINIEFIRDGKTQNATITLSSTTTTTTN
ncbi:S1C family serine protease [uncultured Clostridium sp.]|uniref:S1C family serine protease n=1 Tax=uncultured Clostridium sp. TaxID=59620 RepID=UPI0025EC8589|nr:trypsin-like peptidase domain-containing protein [uncultured Clostridium sp.]MDU4884774.1 trypsin-like peptidase domain-containing protein [Clostridium celatum]MDU7078013.1 trypsin-like peptidase domain-containing protein [Clostridium celatum]